MPELNAFEFLDAYQDLQFDQKESLVIVILTTTENPKDIERLRKKPIKGVMNKPLAKEKVQNLLWQHFSEKIS